MNKHFTLQETVLCTLTWGALQKEELLIMRGISQGGCAGENSFLAQSLARKVLSRGRLRRLLLVQGLLPAATL